MAFISSVYLLAVYTTVFLKVPTIEGGVNFFYPGWNPNNGYAGGFMYYNNTGFVPTCGFVVILTCSVPFSAQGWDFSNTVIDDYTLLLTSSIDGIAYRSSQLQLNGQFINNVWPEVVANYFCVCNESTGGSCLNVPYDVASRQGITTTTTAGIVLVSASVAVATTAANTLPTSVSTTSPSLTATAPRTSAATTSPLLAATTSTTIEAVTSSTAASTIASAAPTAASVTVFRMNSSLPTMTLEDVLSAADSAAFSESIVSTIEHLCYTGSLYTTLVGINHFVDCCTLCCTYKKCQAINFHRSSSQCDLIFDTSLLSNRSSLMGDLPDCTFWKVSYRT